MTDSLDQLIGFSPPPHNHGSSFTSPSPPPCSTTGSKNATPVMATNEDETIKLDSTDSEPKKDGHEEDQEKKSDKEILLDIAKSHIIILFRDQHGDELAWMTVKDHIEIFLIRSDRFKKYLSKIYFVYTGLIGSTELISQVANFLE
jgi:hypothetical protein